MRVLQLLLAVGVMILGTSARSELTEEQIAQLYAKPSPFESSPRDRWIAESENAFAVRWVLRAGSPKSNVSRGRAFAWS